MTAQPRPNDHTGRQRAKLAKEHEADLALRADEISLMNAVQAEKDASEVVDLTASQPRVTVLDEVEDQGVSLADEFEVIQVVDDIEQMTFGVGNHLSFKAGKKYKVTKAVASHLREKGYVWGA